MFVAPRVIGSHRPQSPHIAAHASQKFSTCDFVASIDIELRSMVYDCEHASLCCKGWDCLWTLVSIH